MIMMVVKLFLSLSSHTTLGILRDLHKNFIYSSWQHYQLSYSSFVDEKKLGPNNGKELLRSDYEGAAASPSEACDLCSLTWNIACLRFMGWVDFFFARSVLFFQLLPSLAVPVGKPVACAQRARGLTSTPFLSPTSGSSQRSPHSPGEASHSVRCFMSLPLQPPPAPEWHPSKLQSVLGSATWLPINRILSFEIVALPGGRCF